MEIWLVDTGMSRLMDRHGYTNDTNEVYACAWHCINYYINKQGHYRSLYMWPLIFLFGASLTDHILVPAIQRAIKKNGTLAGSL